MSARSCRTRLTVFAAVLLLAASLSALVGVAQAAAGSFAPAVDWGTGASPRSIAVGDFNHDGNTDLVTAGQVFPASSVTVLWGDGSGGFASAGFFAVGNQAVWVAVADVNHDGNEDLAVANIGDDTVSVLLGNGAGGFPTRTDYAVGDAPFRVVIRDVNNDGNQDLAVLHNLGVSVLLGNGSGAFVTHGDYPVESSAGSLAAGDFNGDGRQDLALADYETDSVGVAFGDGGGGFGAETTVAAVSNPMSLAVGDFDADGKRDLAVAATSSEVTVLTGNGDGTFSFRSSCPDGGVRSIAADDFNADGKQDLVAVTPGPDTVNVLLGDGTGGFAALPAAAAGVDPEAVAVGDFNHDGRRDVAAANYIAGTVSVLLNNGIFPLSGTMTINGDAPWTGSTAVTVDSSVAGATEMRLREPGYPWGDWQPYSGTVPWRLLPGDGFHPVEAQYRNPGDYELSIGRGISLDTAAPDTSDDAPDIWVPISPFNVTLTPDDGSGSGMSGGLARTEYRVDGAPGWSTGAVAPVLGNGAHTVFYRSTDAVGNVEATRSRTVKIDTAPPTTAQSGADGAWHGSPVTVVFSAFDAGSGVAANQYSTEAGVTWTQAASVTISAEGDTTLWYRSIDNVGNLETRHVAHVLIDTTPPTATTDNAPTGWQTGSPVEVTLTPGVDTGSGMSGGLARTEYRIDGATGWTTGATVPVSGDGVHTIRYRSVDAVGNKEDAELCGVKIDSTAPTTTQSGTDSAWHHVPVTVVFSASDTTSGVAGSQYSTDAGSHWTTSPSVTISAAGDTTLWYRSQDVAGNLEAYHVAHVRLDVTPPTTTDDGPADWQTGSPVNVALIPDDGGFAPRADHAGGDHPLCVAVGDFNGDSKADLVAANGGSAGVAVFLNSGSGDFGAPVVCAVNSNPTAVAVGDFNTDGKDDLVTSNGGSNDVSILLGDGSGGFAAHVDHAVGSSPMDVAVGDFNGDGKADLAVTDFSSFYVSILLGDGSGGFAAHVDYLSGYHSLALAVGDFNTDGKADLAVTHYDADYLSILSGDGSGGFAARADYDVGTGQFWVAVDDLNADGKDDLATANANANSCRVLLNDGSGGFPAHIDHDLGLSSTPRSVAVGDFNGDGTSDLVAANQSNNRVAVLLGDGDGGFAAHVDYAAGSYPYSVAVGDFNADGRDDVATANWLSNDVSVLLREGSGMGGGAAATQFKLDGAETWSTGTTVAVSGDGIHTVSYRSIDNAGNVEDARNCTVKIDTTAPVTTVHGADAAWHSWPQTVFLTAADAGSGMSGGAAKVEYDLDGAGWVTGDMVLIVPDGDHILQVRSTDALGNRESPQTVHVKIDTAAPVTTDNSDGATHRSFTLVLTPTDATSDVASTEYRIDGGAWQVGTTVTLRVAIRHKRGGYGHGDHVVEYRSTDNAGNVETIESCTVTIG